MNLVSAQFAKLEYMNLVSAQFAKLEYMNLVSAQFAKLEYMNLVSAQFAKLEYMNLVSAQFAKLEYINQVSAQFAKCQTPPWTRNICYIALNSIPTTKCSRIPSNSTGMSERRWRQQRQQMGNIRSSHTHQHMWLDGLYIINP